MVLCSRKKFYLNVIVFLLSTFAYSAGYAEEKKDADSLLKGKEIFHERCAVCHGADGNAMLPGAPSFAAGERLDKSDEELLKTIRHGKDMMPPWEGVLSSNEQHDTLSYVRVIVGDKVFEDKCLKCHEKIPRIPPDIPDEKALKDSGDAIRICKACEIEKELTREEQIEVIRFIRHIGKSKK